MTLPWEPTPATLAGVDLDDNPYGRHQTANNDCVSFNNLPSNR